MPRSTMIQSGKSLNRSGGPCYMLDPTSFVPRGSTNRDPKDGTKRKEEYMQDPAKIPATFDQRFEISHSYGNRGDQPSEF